MIEKVALKYNRIDFSRTILNGAMGRVCRFAVNEQLKDASLWKLLVNQFREQTDSINGNWRGEYWGKNMRGACYVYYGTRDAELYGVLKDTVSDLICVQDGLGRISTYSTQTEFSGWDTWSRKYVMLGLEYFYEICAEQDFKVKVLSSIKAHADYIIGKIGKGKLDILDTSNCHYGLNSSSIIEPFMKLYFITGETKYLDFARYVIERGGTSVGNLFQIAYEDKTPICEYPVTKCYEMISCFEGIILYHFATGDEKCRELVLRFADRLIDEELTVAGSSGCRHEYFNSSKRTQTNVTDVLVQETCVTVTLMKFFLELFVLSGDVKYIDYMEYSAYNAYLSAVNFDGQSILRVNSELVFPFDSYSPLSCGRRGEEVGGFLPISANRFCGCCVSIGALGCGVMQKAACIKCDGSYYVNFYEDLTASIDGGSIKITSAYPFDGKAQIEVTCDGKLKLNLRVPRYADGYSIAYDGKSIEGETGGGYVPLELTVDGKAIITVDFKLSLIRNEINGYSYYAYGGILLSADERLGLIDTPAVTDGFTYEPVKTPVKNNLSFKLSDGKNALTLVDYSSAGKEWNKEKNKLNVFFE